MHLIGHDCSYPTCSMFHGPYPTHSMICEKQGSIWLSFVIIWLESLAIGVNYGNSLDFIARELVVYARNGHVLSCLVL